MDKHKININLAHDIAGIILRITVSTTHTHTHTFTSAIVRPSLVSERGASGVRPGSGFIYVTVYLPLMQVNNHIRRSIGYQFDDNDHLS